MRDNGVLQQQGVRARGNHFSRALGEDLVWTTLLRLRVRAKQDSRWLLQQCLPCGEAFTDVKSEQG